MPKKNRRVDVFRHIDMRGGDTTQCWPWKRSLRKGKLSELRPIFKCEGEEWYAYRLVWVLHNGRELEEREFIRHTCDNSTCCNPHHLIVGTQKDNVQDTMKRERHGHKIIDVKKVMDLLEIGCTSAYISEYMKSNRGVSMDSSSIRRIKRRETYTHIEWAWGDKWAKANQGRLDNTDDCGIMSNQSGEDDGQDTN